MDESKIARYLDRYLEKSNVLLAIDSVTVKRLKRYVSFCEKKKDDGILFRYKGETVLDDIEVPLENASYVLPAARLLDALEYIPDFFEED